MEFNWEKKGLIYEPPFDGSWKDNSALTPTPLLLEDRIRVFCGFRDPEGISRIGYVDVDLDNPSKIITISKNPVLDVGANGMFDDNGLILGDLITFDNKIYMYYVGFQLVKKAKFLAYTGLAISHDLGMNFERVSDVPVLDRTKNATLFNAIHTIIYEDNKFKAWCGAGSSWCNISKTDYPSYNVQYYESLDGVSFSLVNSDGCINLVGDEYRIGRPRVYKESNIYKMIYTIGTLSGTYEMGYAESFDGISWSRKDNEIGICLSLTGWDSKSISYGALVQAFNRKFLFYNGNNMGRDGFGYAELMN